MKVKTLVFVYSIKDVERFIKKNKEDDLLFILCNASNYLNFEKKKINFISLNSFLNQDSFKNHYNQIYSLSNNLFNDFESKVSLEGMNFGKNLWYDLQFILSEPIFFLKQIEPILEKFSPKKIYIYANKELNLSGIYQFFNTDPLYEVLAFLKENYNYEITLYKKRSFKFKNSIINSCLKLLRLFQRLLYKINPHSTASPIIFFSGAKRNFNSFIMPPESEKYKFHRIFSQDNLEYNLSNNRFFLNIFPLLKKRQGHDIFLKNFQDIIENEKFIERFSFEGKNLFNLFKPRIKIIFTKIFPLMVYYKVKFEKLFKSKKPKGLCLMEDVSHFSKIMVDVANKKKIPTFVMKYGINSLKIPSSFWPSYSKYKILWGEADKKIFLAMGAKKETIFSVGCPRFRNYNKKITFSRKQLLKKLRINEKKKIFLFASDFVSFNRSRGFLPGIHISYDEYKNSLEILIKTFINKPKCHLIISLARGTDDLQLVKSLIKENKIKNVSIVSANDFLPQDRINASDAVIVFWSTMGLEAMLLKKPLFVFKLKFREDLVEYLKYGAAFGFNNEKELDKLITNLDKLKTKSYFDNQKKYLQNYLNFKQNSNSLKKIVEIIKLKE